MTRDEALRKLAEENYEAAPGQPFEVGRLQPEDAWGVARCIYKVYGHEYPASTGYLPERLTEEMAARRLFAVVARTPKGDIVGYAALYRSSSPNPGVYEIGQVAVVPAYRNTRAGFRMCRLLVRDVAPAEGVVEAFSESVCHHLLIQRSSALLGHLDCALEVGLMPAAAYPREEYADSRVSCVVNSRAYRDRRMAVYAPAPYRAWLEYTLDGFAHERTLADASAALPAGAQTRMEHMYYAPVQVSRTNVFSAGGEFAQEVADREAGALSGGARVLQYCLNLGEPAVGAAVEILRRRGYFYGGYLPRWFDTDALLMQKVLDMPDFRSILLHSDRARAILGFVQADIAAVAALA